MEVMKVSKNTDVKKLAGAIASLVNKGSEIELRAIGAFPLNIMTKAVIVANGLIATSGVSILIQPSFVDVEVAGEKRSAIRFILKY